MDLSQHTRGPPLSPCGAGHGVTACCVSPRLIQCHRPPVGQGMVSPSTTSAIQCHPLPAATTPIPVQPGLELFREHPNLRAGCASPRCPRGVPSVPPCSQPYLAGVHTSLKVSCTDHPGRELTPVHTGAVAPPGADQGHQRLLQRPGHLCWGQGHRGGRRETTGDSRDRWDCPKGWQSLWPLRSRAGMEAGRAFGMEGAGKGGEGQLGGSSPCPGAV